VFYCVCILDVIVSVFGSPVLILFFFFFFFFFFFVPIAFLCFE
jgi:hypothetical protein